MNAALQKLPTFFKTYKVAAVTLVVVGLLVALDVVYRNSDQSFYAKGMEALQAGQADKAISHFSRALRNNPSDPASRAALGWAYHSKGWIDEALKQYEMAEKSSNDAMSMAHFNTGVILQQKKRPREAAAAYSKAIFINPASTGAVLNMGFVQLELGQNELAFASFQKVLTVDPRNVSALYQSGLLYEKQGKKLDAKKLYQAILSFNPGHQLSRDRLKALN